MNLKMKILQLITADENNAEVKTVSLTTLKSGGCYMVIETKPVEQPEPLTQEQIDAARVSYHVDPYRNEPPAHEETKHTATDESSRSANRVD